MGEVIDASATVPVGQICWHLRKKVVVDRMNCFQDPRLLRLQLVSMLLFLTLFCRNYIYVAYSVSAPGAKGLLISYLIDGK